MPNISQPSRQGPYIAFCQAQVWRLILLFGLIFSPFTASAMCADFVVNFPQRDPLLAATRFIDLEALSKVSKDQLAGKVTPYLDLQMHLETQIRDLSAKLEDAPDRATWEDISLQLMTFRNDRDLSHDYLDLIERMATKKFQLPDTRVLHKRTVKKGQTDIEAMADLVKDLEKLNKDKSNLVVRFLPLARQDLALAHGTDLYGRPFSDKETTMGQGFMLGENEDLLKERGLKMHDGFAGMPLELAQFNMHVNSPSSRKPEEKIFAPHPDFAAFLRGEMAVAIYDLDQLDEAEMEFYIFKTPSERKKALLALIVPVKG